MGTGSGSLKWDITRRPDRELSQFQGDTTGPVAVAADSPVRRTGCRLHGMHLADVIGIGLLVVIVVPMVVGIGRAIRRHLAARANR